MRMTTWVCMPKPRLIEKEEGCSKVPPRHPL